MSLFYINTSMKKNKIYFSNAEQEIIKCLMDDFGVTYLQATNQVISQKKEAAYMYSQRGNFNLAEHLLREINEWNDEVAIEFKNRGRDMVDKEVKIILPG